MSDYIENDELNDVYLSYNGLNRPALVMGVPIVMLLVLGIIALTTFIFGVKYFGFLGLIPTGLCFIFLMIVRTLTENDPNALVVVSFKLKGFFLKLGSPILRIKG